MATSRMPDWIWDKEWSPKSGYANHYIREWADIWYLQERRRKGSWICYDRKQQKEAWNG